MKILIVEDNRRKIQRLVAHLSGQCGLSQNDLDVAYTTHDAKIKLRAETYDLMILDLAIPLRDDDDPSIATAMELLEELVERDIYRKPRQIVGLTAYDELKQIADPRFKERLWTIILYDEKNDEWLITIQQCVKYICDSISQQPSQRYECDLCVLSALQTPEMDAVNRLPWHWEAPLPLDDVTFIRRGMLSSQGNNFSVVAAVAPRIGMVATALLAAKVIEKCRPRFLAMAGICAGVPGKVNIGDVVLFDPSWDFQNGKRTKHDDKPQFLIAPHQLSVPAFVVSRMETLRHDKALWAEIRSLWPNAPSEALKMVIGPGASGSAVLSDDDTIVEIKNQHRNLIAVEMEAYGLYAASLSVGVPRPTTFALKSVCDFANPAKGDETQAYAAYTSASAIKAFFERFMADIVDLAGT